MRKLFARLTSVRSKLFAAVLITSIAALLVCVASLLAYDLHTFRQASATALEVEAKRLGHGTTAALQFDDAAAASQTLALLEARPTIRMAAIYNPRGAIFAKYARQGIPAELPALPGSEGVAIDGDHVHVFHRIVRDKEIVGTVYLSEDLGLGKRIESYAAITFAVTLVALGVAALLSAWLQRHITRPIIEVSDLARRVVEERDYAVRAHRTTQDEIGTLVDAFNEMLAEIQRRTSALESSSEEIGRLNKDLERRVGERTAQLEESNRQLQTANLAKSNFLSMMSHEIRTPMNGVLGMLELLSLSQLDGHQRNTLEIVRESGKSLLRIIDDILDFSKIEAGKLELRPEPASVERIVASVVAIYSGNASSKGLALSSDVDARISPAVHVDALRLQQILNNLVNNAIKFTSHGRVEIEAELVGREDGRDLVRFLVTDTGIGISAQAQAALFQPFVQADKSISSTFGGTGLGLSIADRLARMMGGSMAVDSEPGQGTTMAVTLPLPVADPAQLAPASGKAHSTERLVRGRRAPPSLQAAEEEGTLVLVVDDHPINRMVLMRQVGVLGYAHDAAANGHEALEMWKSGRYRLVITDCNMPVMDGYELTRNIRALERRMNRPRTTIIACTANALKGEAENCFAVGMDDYLAKPVELSRLLVKLDQWLPIPGLPAFEEPRSDVAEPADAPIDRSALAEVSGGDVQLERQIYAQFLGANDEDVALMRKAIESRDPKLLTHAAHRIKGASRTIGAHALADMAARLETAAGEPDWEAVRSCEAGLYREVKRLAEYLEPWLEARS